MGEIKQIWFLLSPWSRHMDVARGGDFVKASGGQETESPLIPAQAVLGHRVNTPFLRAENLESL